MSTKTAEGLRNRLFEALDALIDGKIGAKEVEPICYLSEQIIKTAQIEIEIARELNRNEENKRQYELLIIREKKESIKKLSEAIEVLGDE